MLMVAPKLNPEAKAASSESNIKRDEKLMATQSQIAAVLAALGKALTQLLEVQNKEDGNLLLIELISDAVRLLADLHCQKTETRRALLNLNFNKEVAVVLKETPADTWLFGENLSDRIKSAKAMERSSQDLKSRKVTQKKSYYSPINSKSPPKRQNMRRLGGQWNKHQKQPNQSQRVQRYQNNSRYQKQSKERREHLR
nr:unnamed protein product [Callosobruchus analis]